MRGSTTVPLTVVRVELTQRDAQLSRVSGVFSRLVTTFGRPRDGFGVGVQGIVELCESSFT